MHIDERNHSPSTACFLSFFYVERRENTRKCVLEFSIYVGRKREGELWKAEWGVGKVRNFLGSVLLRKRFEIADQCYSHSSVRAQSFIW